MIVSAEMGGYGFASKCRAKQDLPLSSAVSVELAARLTLFCNVFTSLVSAMIFRTRKKHFDEIKLKFYNAIRNSKCQMLQNNKQRFNSNSGELTQKCITAKSLQKLIHCV